MPRKKILVTGGAGYIGSHTVRQLGEAGHDIVVLDNLSKGFREQVLFGEFVQGDTADQELVSRILQSHDIDTVIHFAAHTIVPESVEDPLKYYRNNTCATRNLLECCETHGVGQFVFSSTAAVYGEPDVEKCWEDSPLQPINPYGMSKLMSERMLQDMGSAGKMRYVYYLLHGFIVLQCFFDHFTGSVNSSGYTHTTCFWNFPKCIVDSVKLYTFYVHISTECMRNR